MNERVIKRLILIIVILILAIAGVFAYLYFGTDLLKSEEQLFYKYFGKALEIENSDKLAEYINKRLTNNYEITGKYTANLQADVDEQTNDGLDKINNARIEFTGKVDNVSHKNEHNFNIRYSDDVSFPFNFRSSNNLIGLQSDYVSSAYIGIENENIQEFLENTIGMQDASGFPDSLEMFSGNSNAQMKELSEEEKKHLQDTYLPIIQEALSSKEFTASEENSVTSYNVTVSQDDLNNIMQNVLNTAREDDMVLSIYEQATNQSRDVLIEAIDNFIEAQSNNDISYDYDGTSSDTIYGYDDTSSDTTYGYDNTSSDITISIEVDDAKNSTIVLKEDGQEIRFGIRCNNEDLVCSLETATQESNDRVYITLTIYGMSSDNVNTVLENGYITSTDDGKEQTYIYQYTSNVTFNDNVSIEDFNNENIQILNDYGQEQVLPFLEQVGARIEEVNKNQMEELGLSEDQNPLILMMPAPIASTIILTNQINESFENMNENMDENTDEDINVAQAREANRLLESNIIAQQAAQQYFSGTEISNLLSMIVSNNTSIKDNEEMQISVTVEASNWDGENKPDGKIVNEDFDSPNMESFYNVEYTKDEATELINQIIITDAE